MKFHLPQFPKRGAAKPPQQQAQQAQRVLRASARSRPMPAVEDDDVHDEEPTMRLSSAFVVVLLLHVVAIGGIYAFHSLKAQRKNQELAAMAERGEMPGKADATPAPTADPAPAEVPAPAPAQMHPAPASGAMVNGYRIYQVKDGDTLTRIAAANDVSTADLAGVNGMKETATLRAGQSLNIPRAKAGTKPAADTRKDALAKHDEKTKPTAGAKTYTVVKGDNPVAIARKFGCTQDELLKLNKIDDPKKLQIGAVLKVPQK